MVLAPMGPSDPPCGGRTGHIGVGHHVVAVVVDQLLHGIKGEHDTRVRS
jgi:hypothetical protein